jgi:transcriptional regulator NrdR family protein
MNCIICGQELRTCKTIRQNEDNETIRHKYCQNCGTLNVTCEYIFSYRPIRTYSKGKKVK